MKLSEGNERFGHPDPWNPDRLWLPSVMVCAVDHFEHSLEAVGAGCDDNLEGDSVAGDVRSLGEKFVAFLLNVRHCWLESFFCDLEKEDHKSREGV